MARSGPSRNLVQPEPSRVDPLVLSETERLLIKRMIRSKSFRSRRGCSATEDTSAKESSAGELTEHDEIDKQNRLTRVCTSKLKQKKRNTLFYRFLSMITLVVRDFLKLKL